MENAGVRQTHLLTRLLVLLLAAAAAVLVALPSPADWPQAVSGMGWAALAMPVLNIAAWASCALAAVLAWRSTEHQAALPLALFLSFAALGYGVVSAPPLGSSFEAFPETWRIRLGVLTATLLLASWALFDFGSKFPTAISAGQLRAALEEANPLKARESLLTGVFTLGWARRSRWQAYIMHRQWLGLRGFVWLVLSGLGLTVIWTWTAPISPFARFAFPVVLLGSASWMIPLRYVASGQRDRRRIQWATLGFGALYWTIFAALFVGPTDQFMDLTTVGFGWLALVTCLAIAVFKDGVFDPALIIRKSALYGALLPILAVVFAGVENIVSDNLAERVGLPGSIAPWLGALVAVLLFGPLRNRISKFTERLFRDGPQGSADETAPPRS